MHQTRNRNLESLRSSGTNRGLLVTFNGFPSAFFTPLFKYQNEWLGNLMGAAGTIGHSFRAALGLLSSRSSATFTHSQFMRRSADTHTHYTDTTCTHRRRQTHTLTGMHTLTQIHRHTHTHTHTDTHTLSHSLTHVRQG